MWREFWAVCLRRAAWRAAKLCARGCVAAVQEACMPDELVPLCTAVPENAVHARSVSGQSADPNTFHPTAFHPAAMTCSSTWATRRASVPSPSPIPPHRSPSPLARRHRTQLLHPRRSLPQQPRHRRQMRRQQQRVQQWEHRQRLMRLLLQQPQRQLRCQQPRRRERQRRQQLSLRQLWWRLQPPARSSS